MTRSTVQLLEVFQAIEKTLAHQERPRISDLKDIRLIPAKGGETNALLAHVIRKRNFLTPEETLYVVLTLGNEKRMARLLYRSKARINRERLSVKVFEKLPDGRLHAIIEHTIKSVAWQTSFVF